MPVSVHIFFLGKSVGVAILLGRETWLRILKTFMSIKGYIRYYPLSLSHWNRE